MKKFTLIFIIAIQSILLSQELNYGVSSSVNMNTTTSQGHDFTQNRSSVGFKSERSYNFGLVALFNFHPKIALNTSFLFTSKLVSTHWSGPADGPVDATLHFYFLSLSPKLEYNPLFNFFLNAGPSIDFRINTKLEQTGDYVEDINEIRETNIVRLGLQFSLGYKLEITNSIWIAPEISYDLALTDTNPIYGGKYSTTRIGLALFIK